MTWRATRLRTKTGNFVIVPNNIIGKEAIINFGAGGATRLDVAVASAMTPPPSRQRVILEALRNCPLALELRHGDHFQ